MMRQQQVDVRPELGTSWKRIISDHSTAVQRQKAVAAYLDSKQLLPFGFALGAQ